MTNTVAEIYAGFRESCDRSLALCKFSCFTGGSIVLIAQLMKIWKRKCRYWGINGGIRLHGLLKVADIESKI